MSHMIKIERESFTAHIHHNSDWSGDVDIHVDMFRIEGRKPFDALIPGEVFREVARRIFEDRDTSPGPNLSNRYCAGTVMIKVTYSPRGPGHEALATVFFDHDPSPQEVADAIGIKAGPHYHRIIDGSYTVEIVKVHRAQKHKKEEGDEECPVCHGVGFACFCGGEPRTNRDA